MTRASLGHPGREIIADRVVVAAYAAVTAGAVLRVAAPLMEDWYAHQLVCGGALWSAAFLLFRIRYAPILWGRRDRSLTPAERVRCSCRGHVTKKGIEKPT